MGIIECQQKERMGERRWPMSVAVLVAMVLQYVAPEAGRLTPRWFIPAFELVLLVILVAGDPGRLHKPPRALRAITIFLIGIMTVATLAGVTVLMADILWNIKGASSAAALFGRGAALWVTNIIVFSLWFWQFDRGGPVERATRSQTPPSFVFPEMAYSEHARRDWMPAYPDYLYLAFTNATAFSPADTLPVRTWAKMLMLVESFISLVTAVIVIARAIGVIPG